ncbi:MAG: hypothetical protein J0L53_17520 [Spirochaetes bacterium]|nr:hypothetical protein [Spirochaetota bacterium]
MKTLILFTTLISTIAIFSQEAGSAVPITVTKGEANVDGINFPVFAKITTVEKGQYGGVQYTITEANGKAALRKADQIKKFYQGRKIGKVKFGGFKKASKPGSVAWVATAGKGQDTFGAIIKVEDATVTVYVMPGYEDAVQAFIL